MQCSMPKRPRRPFEKQHEVIESVYDFELPDRGVSRFPLDENVSYPTRLDGRAPGELRIERGCL